MPNDTRELIPEGVTLEQRIELALERINDLDQRRRSWIMSIPPQWDDSDILIADVIHDMQAEIERLRVELEKRNIQDRYVIYFCANGESDSRLWIGDWNNFNAAKLDAFQKSSDDKHHIVIYDRVKGRDVWTSENPANDPSH